MDASWQRCLSAFLSSIEDISGSTRSHETYAYTLNRFFQDGRNPDEYSRADVHAFIDAPSAQPYKLGNPVKAGS